MHLVGALGRDEQVDPVLASLGRDLDGRSVEIRLTRSSGSAAQMLCASSITTSTGCRVPAGSTASQHRVRDHALLLERLQRAEVHDHAAAGGLLQLLEQGRPSGLQTAQSSTPRLSARMPRCWALGFGEPISWSRPAIKGMPALVVAEEVGQYGVLVPVGDRVQPQDRALGARVELGEAQLQQPLGAGLVAPHRDVVGDGDGAGPRRVGSVADPPSPT